MAGMNDNWDLYEVSLLYNKMTQPYQSLSLPWWIKTRQPTYPPRHRCVLEPINCGENLFRSIFNDISNAKQTVDIATWGFDPGMVLIRGPRGEGTRYGDLLIEVATRAKNPVVVRLLVWHDDAFSQTAMKNAPGLYGLRFPAIGSAMNGFYSEAHRDFNAKWYSEVCAKKYPNIIFHVRMVPTGFLEKALEGERVPSNIEADFAKMYAAHHQKMVLIDYDAPQVCVGYVMGHNSTTDFWDTETHEFQNPRRETVYKKDPSKAWEQGPGLDNGGGGFAGAAQPSESELAVKALAVKRYLDDNCYICKPYQDVSLRVKGPIVFDVNHNFCQAWGESTPAHPLFVESFVMLGRLTSWIIESSKVGKMLDIASSVITPKKIAIPEDFIRQRSVKTPDDYAIPSAVHSAQLLRTQPLHGEKTMKECYANLNRQVLHYMFIQNQYVQYGPWADHLIECIGRLRAAGYNQNIYVFILTSTPEKDGMDLSTYDVAKRIGQSETMPIEHAVSMDAIRKGKKGVLVDREQMENAGIKVVLGSLWTAREAPRAASDYEEIYIHSKVAIVDDAAFTIGSANLNLRSMAFDSELNVISQASDVAFDLRCRLFKQVSEISQPVKFGDMKETFGRWKKLMEDDYDNKESFRPLDGNIVNFFVRRAPGNPVI